MQRNLILTFALIVLSAQTALAQYAVRFGSATVAQGQEFTVDLILENDQILGGAHIPFRWSTGDLTYLGFEWINDRLIGNITGIASPPGISGRTSSILIFGNRGEGWIATGNSPIGQMRFRVSSFASDQYAFVDSVYEKAGEIVTQQVNLSNFDGSVSIFPPVYPGVIKIGNPPPATISIVPSTYSVRGETGALNPVLRSLEIRSDAATQFDWEATWSTDWLTVTPSIGKTPALPSLSFDAFFLFPGQYFDTVVISSPIAENSPVIIPVAFTVDTAGTRPPEGFNFTLFQSRPSPFVAYSDPETTIPFVLQEPDRVEIALYDILGRRIRTLASAQFNEGEGAVIWDGRDGNGIAVASGNYLCRMTTSKGESSQVIVLIR